MILVITVLNNINIFYIIITSLNHHHMFGNITYSLERGLHILHIYLGL